MAAIELIAHRGYPRYYPENTLAGFEAAVSAGARFVETDVQLSLDGVPFLFHDRNMDRVCGMESAIGDHTAQELDTIAAMEKPRFGDRFVNEMIPRLSAFVQWLLRQSEVHAFVEIKRGTIEQFGIETILDTVTRELEPVRDRCILISFSYEFMLAARHGGYGPVGVVLEHWRDRKLEIVDHIAPEYLFLDVEFLPRWRSWRIPGPKLAVYEIDRPGQARRLAAQGADFIETFSFIEMQQALV
jgi:glycerophosphoryl diester phosphodiesterase